eukprot:Trichotokara_eunicae@DN2972_c0_g1_i1.p1
MSSSEDDLPLKSRRAAPKRNSTTEKPSPKRKKRPASSSDSSDDAKPLNKRKSIAKSDKEPKAKAKSRASPKAKTATVKAKAKNPAAKSNVEEFEKGDARRFFKEGQKHICPSNGDGTRAFYESMLTENPFSIMAIRYCVEYGCLQGTHHKDVLKKYAYLRANGGFTRGNGGLKKDLVDALKKDTVEADKKAAK